MHDANAVLEQLAAEYTRRGAVLYYDVSVLFEERWTGISIVAASLARVLLDWLPERTHFFFEHALVKREAVEEALARGSGLFLAHDFFAGRAKEGPITLLGDQEVAIGIYPSVKRVSQLFPIECSIYHDISTLITPQFHTIDNIRHHIHALVDDLRTNTITFGVSAATVEDLEHYLGADPARLSVAFNGVSWPWWYEVQAENDVDPARVEPYYLVLGTREPRKNLNRIFELLSVFPDLLDDARFVIAGKVGWLAEQHAVPPALQEAIRDERLVFPGYVTDYEKYRLLRGARATIYPSFFEGFGLPVLESLSVGTPCVASISSSIPEVGGDACVYFDPFSAESLYAAVRYVEQAKLKDQPGFRAACRAIAQRFSWDNMLAQILTRMAVELDASGGVPEAAREVGD